MLPNMLSELTFGTPKKMTVKRVLQLKIKIHRKYYEK